MNAARPVAAGLALALASALAGAAAAQPVGPPIPPDQVFRSQPMPQTTVPPPAPSPPVGPSQPPRGLTGQRGPEPRPSAPGDRARDCQHQAAVERVPARDRASYVHNCLQGN